MSLSQSKIDLAVLYKLHQHAEAGEDAIPPIEVSRLFDIEIPVRRIELALEALEAKGDVQRKYMHFYTDEGAWEISRDGMIRVDRALRVPASFIGRLHQGGDHWLESDEAHKAILRRLSEPEASTHASTGVAKEFPKPHASKIDWTKWGVVTGTVLGILAIIVAKGWL